jgi:adenine-specific DNA-methyltransferase
MKLPLSVGAARFGPVNNPAPAPAPTRQKELGAFYTPPAMARVLTDWALRSPGDHALDPSFGGFVFLAAARSRLQELGASSEVLADQLYGVDLDEDAHRVAREDSWLGLSRDHFLLQDFFSVEPASLPSFEALIGNPPYIRFQDFNGSAAAARRLASEAGVKLTGLASSWAPFVVHATSFVAPGGRLAQVLPAELLQAQYAHEVVQFLRREFGEIFIAVFDERVFPGALEDVVLLFADGRGAQGMADVRLIPCAGVADVERRLKDATETEPSGRRPIGNGRLLGQLLPFETQKLYDRASEHDDVRRFSDLASVDIGIVTGANAFFVLDQDSAAALHPDLLRPAVAKAAQVAGARLSVDDHQELLNRGQRGLMFVANGSNSDEAVASARNHLAEGEQAKLHERFKCRIRKPWWALPIPQQGTPDLLLTYCSNEHPRLALNDAEVLSTNTIHGVRVVAGIEPDVLAAGFYNSLTLLSAELEGRSYGGGVLKLEPSEAESLLLPPLPAELANLLPEVDLAVRARDIDAASDLVDPLTLGAIGFKATDIRKLRLARRQLQMRRKNRGRSPS